MENSLKVNTISISVVPEFSTDSKQLTEVYAIQKRMQLKMDKMMQSVANCHEEMQSQLVMSKDHFEELVQK